VGKTFRTVTGQALHYFLRPHERIPEGPVRSPAAWRGDELERAGDWLTTLSREEVDEVERGLAHARATHKPLAELEKGDLPLPMLGRKIDAWRRQVGEGYGVQVIRGLPVERWSEDDAARFFWCFGRHLGHVGAQNREGELLAHVRDQGRSYDDLSVRGYKTAARLEYHCDLADVVGLLCLRTAKHGGRSRFVSSVTVWNELFERRPDLARRMFEPLAFDTRGDGGLDFFPIVPCRHADGVLRTFYHGDYFRTAERQPGAPRLGPLEHELLETYDAIANSPGMFVEMDFAPGDVQLLSNHTVLHARSPYEDHVEPERKRHLLRLWLSLDRGHPRRAWPSLGREGARLLAGIGVGRLRKIIATAAAR
jgi:hypothetical protein